MNYRCELCNYSTQDSGNWYKHIKTQTHIKKSNEYENRKKESERDYEELKSKYELLESNHKSKCEELVELKHKCELLELKSKEYDEMKRKYEELELNYKKAMKSYQKTTEKMADNIVDVAGKAMKVANNSCSAIKYITQNFTNAPLLEPMKNYKTVDNVGKDKKFVLALCDMYSDDRLIRYLGDRLTEYYKKENPEEQSLWNSDCARLNYIIRTVIEKKNEWIIDKKGNRLKDCVVRPLLQHIKDEIINFTANTENKEYCNRFITCFRIVEDINNKTMDDELIKHLAPHFHLTNIK
jgi:hypothetical protein